MLKRWNYSEKTISAYSALFGDFVALINFD